MDSKKINTSLFQLKKGKRAWQHQKTNATNTRSFILDLKLYNVYYLCRTIVVTVESLVEWLSTTRNTT